MCAHSYFLTYVLGIRTPSGKKATKGNVVHKALELLARQKKCNQDGLKGYDDESFGFIKADDINPEWAIEKSYEYYTQTSPHHSWFPYDYRDCQEWTLKALSLNKGMFDPRNHNIIEPEQKFDFVVDRPWSHYRYELDGKVIDGQLSLKGTVDLVIEDEPGLVELYDWKTGQRKDWSKNGSEKKTYKELRYDPQLCLYHYAATRLFPEAEEIFLTIVFINDGGPYTLCFDKSDIEFTERIIEHKFKQIRDTQIPALSKSWKCTKFCHFGMNRAPQDPSKTICQFYADKVRKNGLEETMIEFGRPGAFSEYGDGGGRKSE